MIDPNDRRLNMLRDLEALCGVAMSMDFNQLKEMSWYEQEDFKRNHPGAHLVLGDFEIKCLNPDKYNLRD